MISLWRAYICQDDCISAAVASSMPEQHTAKQQLVAFLHHGTLDSGTAQSEPLVRRDVYRYSTEQIFVEGINISLKIDAGLSFRI